MNREIVQLAVTRTRQTLTRSKWWGVVLTFSVFMMLFALVVPLSLLAETGVLRSAIEEFSLSNESSLVRLMLPVFLIIAAFVCCSIVVQFLTEIWRILRDQG